MVIRTKVATKWYGKKEPKELVLVAGLTYPTLHGKVDEGEAVKKLIENSGKNPWTG